MQHAGSMNSRCKRRCSSASSDSGSYRNCWSDADLLREGEQRWEAVSAEIEPCTPSWRHLRYCHCHQSLRCLQNFEEREDRKRLLRDMAKTKQSAAGGGQRKDCSSAANGVAGTSDPVLLHIPVHESAWAGYSEAYVGVRVLPKVSKRWNRPGTGSAAADCHTGWETEPDIEQMASQESKSMEMGAEDSQSAVVCMELG